MANREYKDSLFRFLFNTLSAAFSLYRAIAPGMLHRQRTSRSIRWIPFSWIEAKLSPVRRLQPLRK